MDPLCIITLDDSGKSDTYCVCCMCSIMETENAWVTKTGKHFCCWECVKEYELLQSSYCHPNPLNHAV